MPKTKENIEKRVLKRVSCLKKKEKKERKRKVSSLEFNTKTKGRNVLCSRPKKIVLISRPKKEEKTTSGF